eukprot:gene7849-9702_t
MEPTMVKKLKSLANADDKQLASAVRNSAQQIWQAGLGAFAKAQEEGGRVFAKLVKEGNALQQRTRDLAEDKVSEVRETVSGVSKQAAATDGQVLQKRLMSDAAAVAAAVSAESAPELPPYVGISLAEVRLALGQRSVQEFGGIEPNPSYETLMRAVQLVRAEKLDFLLAV